MVSGEVCIGHMTSLCSCSANSVTCLSNKWNGGGSNIRRRPFTVVALSQSRRSTAIFISSLPFTFLFLSPPPPAESRERRKKNNIPIDDYLTSPDGLKYYDFLEGKGPIAEKGSTVQVHFDCLYRGITAVSSRESKILAGNRVIAQPYVFKVGAQPGKERKREFVDNPNGLFSAQAAPKPPAAMYTIVEGMRVGGKRTVIVPPEKGYGPKGKNEIPPGATFELNIELLQVAST
ncbi:FKBP peptidyl-prolyl cis-trans isomerase family protein [Trifolium repens]|nr:FKBP peptidyl-prolyl cis-trans isomerase family protein [Trifolium repens]